MRRETTIIETQPLSLHIEYDYMTLGELGNILVRYQAALRAMAGLTRDSYDFEISKVRPRFVTSQISTGHSIDLNTQVAIATLAVQLPQILSTWKIFIPELYRRLKMAVAAMAQGELPKISTTPDNDEDLYEVSNDKPQRFTVTVTSDDIYMKANRRFIDNMTPNQKRTISNLLWAFGGPANKVEITDRESSIKLEYVANQKQTRR